MNLIECYTLNSTEVVHGIAASNYDSIITDTDCVKFAYVQMIPIFDVPAAKIEENSATSVSFVHGFETCDTADKSNILLSYAPEDWRLVSSSTKLTLLDPAGVSDSILILIPKNSGVVLESARNKNSYLLVDSAGNPKIQHRNRAEMMLNALIDKHV